MLMFGLDLCLMSVSLLSRLCENSTSAAVLSQLCFVSQSDTVKLSSSA